MRCKERRKLLPDQTKTDKYLNHLDFQQQTGATSRRGPGGKIKLQESPTIGEFRFDSTHLWILFRGVEFWKLAVNVGQERPKKGNMGGIKLCALEGKGARGRCDGWKKFSIGSEEK